MDLKLPELLSLKFHRHRMDFQRITFMPPGQLCGLPPFIRRALSPDQVGAHVQFSLLQVREKFRLVPLVIRFSGAVMCLLSSP